MSAPNSESSSSVIEKLKSAGNTIGLNPDLIVKELEKLAEEDDAKGMKELFDAFINWELRGRNPGVSVKDVTQIALDNFDFLAQVADGLFIEQGHSEGRTTKLYRYVVGYEPSK